MKPSYSNKMQNLKIQVKEINVSSMIVLKTVSNKQFHESQILNNHGDEENPICVDIKCRSPCNNDVAESSIYLSDSLDIVVETQIKNEEVVNLVIEKEGKTEAKSLGEKEDNV